MHITLRVRRGCDREHGFRLMCMRMYIKAKQPDTQYKNTHTRNASAIYDNDPYASNTHIYTHNARYLHFYDDAYHIHNTSAIFDGAYASFYNACESDSVIAFAYIIFNIALDILG